MIRGIGVDIIEIARIRSSIQSAGGQFLTKVFTDGEIAYCSARANADQHYAARFAAKEAVSKALATGWSGVFRWKDVEVTNAPSGQPLVTLHGDLRESLAGARLLVSLSHSDSHVVAVAVIEDTGT
ncbi:MAG TPA: holo-ACP synthase [Bacteroidota bacterium]